MSFKAKVTMRSALEDGLIRSLIGIHASKCVKTHGIFQKKLSKSKTIAIQRSFELHTTSVLQKYIKCVVFSLVIKCSPSNYICSNYIRPVAFFI